ncbi:MAG: C39 family peptidase [Planctomycetota bacterium]|nr:C39 family peptidase [Planctomycetota bacterium]
MRPELEINILPQPTDTTCGPTCLHAVYRWFGDDIELEEVIKTTPMLEGGGTLAVLLGCCALERGYKATIYTWNLQVFDLTWFGSGVDLRERLQAQRKCKSSARLLNATDAYLRFLELGGEIRHEPLTGNLLRRYLRAGTPLLTGLSATYLYQSARELDVDGKTVYDDIAGEPAGHFVVLSGYDAQERRVRVADPYLANPVTGGHHYEVDMSRLVASLFLGIVTYDANILVVRPANSDVDTPRSR